MKRSQRWRFGVHIDYQNPLLTMKNRQVTSIARPAIYENDEAVSKNEKKIRQNIQNRFYPVPKQS